MMRDALTDVSEHLTVKNPEKLVARIRKWMRKSGSWQQESEWHTGGLGQGAFYQ